MPDILSSRLRSLAYIPALGILFCGAVFSGSFEKGGELYMAGDLPGALAKYEDAIKSGSNPDAYLNAALTARELGDIVRARDIMTSALGKYGTDLRIRRMAASVYLSAGEFAKSEELYSAIVREANILLSSDYIGLARASYWLKNYPAAIDAANKAIELDPNASSALFFKGESYAELGRTDDAVDAFSQLLGVDAQFIEARRHIAELRLAQKKVDEAWSNYQKLAYAEPAVKQFKKLADGLKKDLSKKPAAIMPPVVASAHRKPSVAEDTEGLPTLRVGIGSTASGQPSDSGMVEFITSSPFEIVDAKSGARLLRGPANKKWRIAISKNNPKKAWIKDSSGSPKFAFTSAIIIRQPDKKTPNTTIIKSLLLGHGTAWAAVADRELRGDIEIRKTDKKLAIINIVNLEEYVYGVLSSEMPIRFPVEALKAQAVLARTYALKNIGKHKAEGYDLCDTQHCQVYGGVGEETGRGNSAVDATRGEIITYEGKPAHTVFSSNSGGFTQSGSGAGWGDVPYWGIVSDYKNLKEPPSQPYGFEELFKTSPEAYCEGSFYVKAPQYRWSRVVQAKDIAKEIASQKDIGEITAIITTRRGGSGHISRMLVKGTKGEFPLEKEYQVRKYLADGLLRSAAFVMEPVYQNGKPVEFLIYGAGWGHGVGFCQSGSSGRANAGQKYKEILEYYYPGTKVEPVKRSK